MTAHVIRRALLSVSDKTGLIEFATKLRAHGVDLVSTGGTSKALQAAGLPVRDVAELTGFPEMLDGRVKTLHPRVHGGILARRDLETHRQQLQQHDLEEIDLVVVNLYPFAATVAKPGVDFEDAVENIDIGGPSMIRGAAKNFHHVAVVTDAGDYVAIADELDANGGALKLGTRYRLARKAFEHTAAYDATISEFLAGRVTFDDETEAFAVSEPEAFPARVTLALQRRQSLRYGENPHQAAALYVAAENTPPGVATAEQLQGKELSFNNLLDLDAAWNLAREFELPACAIIKHTNPCGVGIAAVPLEAFRLALATDPVSAFGGIIAFNAKVDAGTATDISGMFVEAVIAPDYDEAALQVFAGKKNVRVMRVPRETHDSTYVRSISGGFLLQSADAKRITAADLKVATRRQPTEEELSDLLFAWTICKHVKSNAIVYAKGSQLVGVGAGQMSRVDSVKLGATKAQLSLDGSVLASDAFFPFRDGLDEAAKHGVKAIIQPGGSIRDEEVITAADEHGIAMVFTGVRHFRH